jgi:uncharacterized protein (TIGR03067 family)
MRRAIVVVSILISTVAAGRQTMVRAGTETTEAIPANSDLSRLQGRWCGEAGAKRLVQVVLEVQGRQVEASIKLPRGMKMKVRGELRIDERTSPRTLDWVKFNGPDDNELPEILGIYRLENDTLTVVNGGLHGGRPSEFKPGEGLLGELVTFRRVPGDAKDRTVKR